MPDVIIWTALVGGALLLVGCTSMLMVSFRPEWHSGGYRAALKAAVGDLGVYLSSLLDWLVDVLPSLRRGQRARRGEPPREQRGSLVSLANYRPITPSWHDV